MTRAKTRRTRAPRRRRFQRLHELIGRTPLLAIHLRFLGRPSCIHAKLEARNFTGSIKDRMALHILEDAYATGAIRPGDVIAEATSGNTGISFAALGRALGHPVRIFMPDWMSCERVAVLRSLGAELVPVSREEGGFVRCIELARLYAEENAHVFLPRQFENGANVEAHFRTTGPELLRQLALRGRTPRAFVAGVGTGGTAMGVGGYLRRTVAGCGVHPLEPANSPVLSAGRKVGTHRIQGISDEFVPDLVDLSFLDSVVAVWDGDAILMAQRLAHELGLAVGISSGANLLGALELASALGEDAVVATVFPDCNRKYLSTALLEHEEPREGYLTPDVQLLGFDVIRA